MKSNLITAGLLAAALSALTATANTIPVTVLCPNGNSAAGIQVCATRSDGLGPFCATTDGSGLALLTVPSADHYTFCVDLTTLPKNAVLVGSACQDVLTLDPGPNPTLEFVLGGDFCTPPSGGFCWMTGGGTIGKKQQPDFSYGGVVYPGCSPKAADGGNWNVIDHNSGIHFQGQHIVVDDCMGGPTRSPKVTVNIIDFHGDGIVTGVAGNPLAQIPVTFVGRAVDNHDGGAGSDLLFISVSGGYLQIGNSAVDPAVVSTGNIQIQQTSCGN